MGRRRVADFCTTVCKTRTDSSAEPRRATGPQLSFRKRPTVISAHNMTEEEETVTAAWTEW